MATPTWQDLAGAMFDGLDRPYFGIIADAPLNASIDDGGTVPMFWLTNMSRQAALSALRTLLDTLERDPDLLFDARPVAGCS